MRCPTGTSCSLHERLGQKSALAVWQTLFCDSGFERCVRHRLASAGVPVPADLLPDGRSHLPAACPSRPA
jgi:hypothetical protein